MKKLSLDEMKDVKASQFCPICYCMEVVLDAGWTWEEGWDLCRGELGLGKEV